MATATTKTYCSEARLPRDDIEYNAYIERMRQDEYPMLRNKVYLDHAGTTLYSRRTMERFHADMMANLYGNPHSASPSSQLSTEQIESIRLEVMRFFSADPQHFDLVFTANATAGIKIVMEAFREQEDGFQYGYHVDSHTSLIGLREAATKHHCFQTEKALDKWLEDGGDDADRVNLIGFPAQSNMNGRRLPLDWSRRVREYKVWSKGAYTLLDAAAYASTSPLNFTDHDTAPDFTVLSLYKIFGFPDLGALIVRKDASPLFRKRRYFGGGTVDMVICLKEQWHASKTNSLHEQLEDGTLPIHSIIALRSALQAHKELFESMERVSRHVSFLTAKLCDTLSSLKHGNGISVCRLYCSNDSSGSCQGPAVAFNLRDSRGNWISLAEVEKLASIKNFHLRTGGLCNPAGIAVNLGLEAWEMRENFSAGFRCGTDNDILNGKPTGVIRVSTGAMSTLSDINKFLDFIGEFFVDHRPASSTISLSPRLVNHSYNTRWHIESLTVYPIKSCAGWQVPHEKAWEVKAEGLAWDREWCLVSMGTGSALSQKRFPRMALIRPDLDFSAGRLRIRLAGSREEISVPLSQDPSYFDDGIVCDQNTMVCGDTVKARLYASQQTADFFTRAVGTPCTLARFPAVTSGSSTSRHSKQHLGQRSQDFRNTPGPILLSNESPILTISRSSLNRLNEQIKAKGGKAAHPSVFRANIILAESPFLPPGSEQPWAEDLWQEMIIGGTDGSHFGFLGGCRRCQMVCVDQESGEKNEEPFVTLAKTRRFGGRVLFGVHTSLDLHTCSVAPLIRAGETVEIR
ncbi:molybdenum cofactor sulfurase protein-like protein [Polychaeton citri CBS 116435]|uniref:Molybdenum cofactor sulfurase n=1 Tax=Polychaeton citri CBS 116435 TaxID=1314669 RepID=A0A9P4UPR3_9PEZI|nr:molybdenum cofactor sulfurase protein-like protein [Polychaeton citri CBS 116435]